MSSVGEMWMDCKKEGDLNFDVKLILAPFTVDKLSSEQAEFILRCAFDFIQNLSKKF